MNNDEKYMREAMKEANKAALLDEVPIGAVIVCDGKIIARGYNLKETKNNALNHAEIITIHKASLKLKRWRLNDCVIYVTLEPCIMCAGAIWQSRIGKIVFGAYDPKGGAIESTTRIFSLPNINHHPEIIGGILEEENAKILKDYFKNKRTKKMDKIKADR